MQDSHERKFSLKENLISIECFPIFNFSVKADIQLKCQDCPIGYLGHNTSMVAGPPGPQNEPSTMYCTPPVQLIRHWLIHLQHRKKRRKYNDENNKALKKPNMKPNDENNNARKDYIPCLLQEKLNRTQHQTDQSTRCLHQHPYFPISHMMFTK